MLEHSRPLGRCKRGKNMTVEYRVDVENYYTTVRVSKLPYICLVEFHEGQAPQVSIQKVGPQLDVVIVKSFEDDNAGDDALLSAEIILDEYLANK